MPQVKFTVELMVHYADMDKNDSMREAVTRGARHMLATAHLLSDGVKPQIVVYSEDFMHTAQQIEVLPDTIQEGIDATELGEDQGVSSELLAAVRDLKEDRA